MKDKPHHISKSCHNLVELMNNYITTN